MFSVPPGRGVYSRASIFAVGRCLVSWYVVELCPLLNIYLSQSIVDAHMTHYLYHEGEPMQARVIILVSHHVQLYAPGASYITALESSRRFKRLVQSTDSSGQPHEKKLRRKGKGCYG